MTDYLGPVQYLRKAKLTVSDAAGTTLDLSELRFSFDVRMWEGQTPNTAEIKLWNASRITAARVSKEAFFLSLSAGYEGNFGIIFSGEIKQARFGRSVTENYLEIAAADGDIAYNFGIISVSLAAGSNARDVLLACAKVMAEFGVGTAPLPAHLPELRLPRNRVLWGMAREVLRDICGQLGIAWSIQHNLLTFIPTESYLEGDTVVLTSVTGLIGIPEQTQDGVMIACLLNPKLNIGRRIWINNAQVNKQRYSLAYTGEVQNRQIDLVSVAADGYYRILAIDYTGDTRASQWYCILTCLALDDVLPLAQAAKRRVLPPLLRSE